MIAAITAIMSRFGPSGSLKECSKTDEHIRAVMPKISNEVFLGLKYMFVIILEKLIFD
jgi:hypothetical protein